MGRADQLPQVVRAASSTGSFARRLHGGQEQIDEEADDPNHDEELDDREGPPAHEGVRPDLHGEPSTRTATGTRIRSEEDALPTRTLYSPSWMAPGLRL